MISIQSVAMTVSPLFTDHMVLQRDKEVKVWGSAPPGQKVKVSVNQQQFSTVTDESGNWTLVMPPHQKGGPFTLLVEGDETREVSDLYFGEVWIAGGQSNMEWDLQDNVVGHEQEVANAEIPLIRFFDVPNTLSPKKQEQLPEGQWRVASPETAGEFSAVAWFFAKRLQQHEDVAVGIIESNWGGTPAEAWTDIDEVKNVPGYKAMATEVLKTENWPQKLAANEKRNTEKWSRINSVEQALATGAAGIGFDDSSWAIRTLPNTTALHDFVWLRHRFTLSRNEAQSSVALSLGDIVQNAFIFINGKLLATEDWRNGDSLHEVPASMLKAGENVIAIRAANDWDNNVFVGKEGEIWLSVKGEKTDLFADWKYSNQVEPPMPDVKNYSFTPGFLYNAMIYPLLPYAAAGVIWYQGESNVERHPYYAALFSKMIENWRTRANAPDLPFLYVQLAAFLPRQPLQPDSAWAYLRDAQRQTLALPFTGMAVTIDVGNGDDIHPKRKRVVGERLWLQAASKVYGDNILSSGPDYRAMENQGSRIIVHFDHDKGLQTTDGQAPKGFIIAGKDGVFYRGKATIKGRTVEVHHPQVSEPVALRYAWADNPAVNLVNAEGLPAVPFRTDNWNAEHVSAASE